MTHFVVRTVYGLPRVLLSLSTGLRLACDDEEQSYFRASEFFDISIEAQTLTGKLFRHLDAETTAKLVFNLPNRSAVRESQRVSVTEDAQRTFVPAWR